MRAGQRGELVLASMPGVRFPLTVKSVTPVNTAKDGRNLFRVEAPLDVKPDGRLRPGMEGVNLITGLAAECEHGAKLIPVLL